MVNDRGNSSFFRMKSLTHGFMRIDVQGIAWHCLMTSSTASVIPLIAHVPITTCLRSVLIRER